MDKLNDGEIIKSIYINDEITKYFISNHGNVYRELKTGFKKLKPEVNHGYLRVGLHHNGKTCHKRIHRLVGKYFIDNPYGYDIIHHIDNDKTNNHYTNLKWVTSKENSQYAKEDGLILACENHNMAKSNNDEIKFVCALLESGLYDVSEISNITNISMSAIYGIVNNKNWYPISKYYNIENRKKRMVNKNKLDKKLVKKIKKDFKKGLTNMEISIKRQVPRYVVNDIRLGRTYKNI
nr:MAG TPA: homing endonuclease [Caudoviricetes sp.]